MEIWRKFDMVDRRIDEKFIGRLVEELVANFQPQQIILFGSYAYGTPDADSDIDLLIVKETDLAGHQRAFEARNAIGRLSSGIPMDILVMTPGEVRVRLARGDHFIEDIIEKGINLSGNLSWEKEEAHMVEDNSSYAMEWIANADKDLRLVALILENEEDSYGSGFHLQQALEKILKAFLISNGWRLQRIHELERLLDAASVYDTGLESRRSLCRAVSSYYFADRYPDSGAMGPSLGEVRAHLAEVQDLMGKVREFMAG